MTELMQKTIHKMGTKTTRLRKDTSLLRLHGVKVFPAMVVFKIQRAQKMKANLIRYGEMT